MKMPKVSNIDMSKIPLSFFIHQCYTKYGNYGDMYFYNTAGIGSYIEYTGGRYDRNGCTLLGRSAV